MFLWDKPFGRKTFGLTPEFAAASKSLAANQGLYNGFLAAGLVWGLIARRGGGPIRIFFLACVVIAGIFGALTASRKILWVQALPGAIALALVWLRALMSFTVMSSAVRSPVDFVTNAVSSPASVRRHCEARTFRCKECHEPP
jgi:putative membrane protein